MMSWYMSCDGYINLTVFFLFEKKDDVMVYVVKCILLKNLKLEVNYLVLWVGHTDMHQSVPLVMEQA